MQISLNKIGLLKILLCLSISVPVTAQFQWSVPVSNVVSNETKENPKAFLWIPENCIQIRAVVIGQHNMTEETIFENPKFRKEMAKLGIAIIWVTPGFDMIFDFNKTAGMDFESIMNDLAAVSGYNELKYAPAIPIGHSAFASYPWNFAAWNPNRTLAVLSIHGDAPLTNLTGSGRPNPDWENRNIDGVPGLMVEGEYEWWEDRVQPALNFKQHFPNAAISFLCDAGHGHFDISNELIDYLNLFIRKAVQFRLPEKSPFDQPVELIPVNPSDGWLKERWKKDTKPTSATAPYNQYKGDKKDSFWYFDKETANATEVFYAKARGKKEQYIGFVQNGKFLDFNLKSHARINGKFTPGEDGLTFYTQAVFTDSLRSKAILDKTKNKIKISRICGPVTQINDTTFSVFFYRMGLNNEKRTGDIWLMAQSKGDKEHKSSVQQFNIKIPIQNKEGQEQHISFSQISNIKNGVKSISLNAVSDIGMPVYFYVNQGPAEIKDGKLILTKIPPHSAFPIKVTVTAWQYGRSAEPKIKSAAAVEQSFYINP
jgi:hypothetical protein